MQKKKQKMHVRFQNSCKKGAEMQKKIAENAFQFENSCQKRAKIEKRKHIYLDFFRFFSNCKNKHAKKVLKCKKGQNTTTKR